MKGEIIGLEKSLLLISCANEIYYCRLSEITDRNLIQAIQELGDGGRDASKARLLVNFEPSNRAPETLLIEDRERLVRRAKNVAMPAERVLKPRPTSASLMANSPVRYGQAYRVKSPWVLISGEEQSFFYCDLDNVADSDLLIELRKMSLSNADQPPDPIPVSFEIEANSLGNVVIDNQVHFSARNVQAMRPLRWAEMAEFLESDEPLTQEQEAKDGGEQAPGRADASRGPAVPEVAPVPLLVRPVTSEGSDANAVSLSGGGAKQQKNVTGYLCRFEKGCLWFLSEEGKLIPFGARDLIKKFKDVGLSSVLEKSVQEVKPKTSLFPAIRISFTVIDGAASTDPGNRVMPINDVKNFRLLPSTLLAVAKSGSTQKGEIFQVDSKYLRIRSTKGKMYFCKVPYGLTPELRVSIQNWPAPVGPLKQPVKVTFQEDHSVIQKFEGTPYFGARYVQLDVPQSSRAHGLSEELKNQEVPGAIGLIKPEAPTVPTPLPEMKAQPRIKSPRDEILKLLRSDRLREALDHLKSRSLSFDSFVSEIDACIERLLKSGKALSLLECQDYLGATDERSLSDLLRKLYQHGQYRLFLVGALQYNCIESLSEELHSALDALGAGVAAAATQSTQEELLSLQSQVAAAQQQLENLNREFSQVVGEIGARLQSTQDDWQVVSSNRCQQLLSEIELARRLKGLLAVGGASSRGKVRPIPDSTQALTSRDFAYQVLSQAASCWAPGVTEETWVHLHLAILSCKLIQIPVAVWVKAYREAMGEACRHWVLPIESTYLAFDDLWMGGMGTIWSQAVEQPDQLNLILLQDISTSVCSSWLRPLLNLHLGVSEQIRPEVEAGWPENLRVFWTMGDPKFGNEWISDLHKVSAKIVPSARPTPDPGARDPVAKLAAPPAPASISFEQWLSWAGEGPEIFEGPVPKTHGMGTAALAPQLDRLYRAALHFGLTPSEANRITRTLFPVDSSPDP